MTVHHIDVGRDFSRALGPRYRQYGQHSGEEFRDDWLEPAFTKFDTVVVDFDGVEGYSASFLEEVFGGLVRKYGLDAVKKKVQFASVTRPHLVPMIEQWMREAATHRARR